MKFNRRQTWVIGLGLAIVAFLGLRPPWNVKEALESWGVVLQEPFPAISYHFIWSPPKYYAGYESDHVNEFGIHDSGMIGGRSSLTASIAYVVLLVEWFVVLALVTVATIFLRTRPPKSTPVGEAD